MKTRPILGLLTASLLIAAGLHAAEPAQTKTMLVLDASGSMWGQIGGKTKIAIARGAVDSVLDGWDGGGLGLIAGFTGFMLRAPWPGCTRATGNLT